MARDNDHYKSNTTLSALQVDTLLDSTGRTSPWWDNLVNEVVVPEEWRENFTDAKKEPSKAQTAKF